MAENDLDLMVDAEQAMRHDHPAVRDEHWRFWYGVADWLSLAQSRARPGCAYYDKAPNGWSDFNRAREVAISYLAMTGRDREPSHG